MPKTGDKNGDLMALAKKRQKHLDAAFDIERQMKDLLGPKRQRIKPKPTPPESMRGYTDMASSKLATTVIEAAKKQSNKIGTGDVIALLKHNNVRSSPYILLTRMVKANLLQRIGRGVYQVV